ETVGEDVNAIIPVIVLLPRSCLPAPPILSFVECKALPSQAGARGDLQRHHARLGILARPAAVPRGAAVERRDLEPGPAAAGLLGAQVVEVRRDQHVGLARVLSAVRLALPPRDDARRR